MEVHFMKFENAVVSPSDFKNMFGMDLAHILKSSDNDINYPFIFLRLVQDFLLEWCSYNGFRRLHDFSQMSPVQFHAFQEAVLYQAYYAWKNGSVALGLDSGYDAERGFVMSEADLKRAQVPERVIMLLHTSGMFNLNVKNKPRFSKGYPWTGPFTQDC